MLAAAIAPSLSQDGKLLATCVEPASSVQASIGHLESMQQECFRHPNVLGTPNVPAIALFAMASATQRRIRPK